MNSSAIPVLLAVVTWAGAARDSSPTAPAHTPPPAAESQGIIYCQPSIAPGVGDCNENGHGDDLDIALGHSRDDDHDGEPDECEPDGRELPDPAMLEVIASHPMDLFVSDLNPVVHLGVYSPCRDHYRITVIGSPKKRPAVVFNGVLGTGRFWFFWIRRNSMQLRAARRLALTR